MNQTDHSLADFVSRYKLRSGLSFNQISQKSGVPAKTITSWANGFVRRPRQWRDLVSFAHALRLTRAEVNELLAAANHADIGTLLTIAGEAEQKLLRIWQEKQPPLQLPRLHIHHFVGRLQEQQRAANLLLGNERLCVIQGMGGVGKTTLAVQTAKRLKTQFRDGILWADMRNMDNSQILETWALAYDVDLSRLSNIDGRAALMWGILAGKKTLIILDDVISLQRAKQLIPSQLANTAILVTTRQKAVARSLATREQMIISLQPMQQNSSLQLLADTLGTELDLSPHSTELDICHLLGHLPLAINIFARRAKLLLIPLPSLLAELQSIRTRLDKLRVGDEAVRTAFEQSWQLLTEAQQQAFRLLALFSGRNFSLEAFAFLAEVESVPAMTVLGELYALFLLDVVSAEPRRYKQHPLLASFAHEKSLHPPAVALRLATYYLDFAHTHAQNYSTLREEWPNLMAGMRVAHERQAWELVVGYSEALQPAWFSQARFGAARQGYTWAMAAATVLADRERLAEINLHWGIACLEQSDYQEAEQRLAASLDLYQALAHDLGTANALYQRARVRLEQDNHAQAESDLRAAWQHYQMDENLEGMANALYRRGNIAYYRGKYREAAQLCQDALALHRQIHNNLGILKSLLRLTMIALAVDRVEEAQGYCADALTLSESVANEAESARAFYTFANLCRQQGDFDMADEYIHKSLVLFQQMGDRSSEANALNVAALIELEWSQQETARKGYAAAAEWARQSQAICEQLDFLLGAASARLTLGRIYAQQGNNSVACAEWQAALDSARDLNHTALMTRLQELSSEICG